MTEQQLILIQYLKDNLIYAKRIRPVFLNALKRASDPAIYWIDQNGAGNVPLELLVNNLVFVQSMTQAYNMVAPLAAKREWFYQKRTKDDILDILSSAWFGIFREYALNYAYRISNELAETTRESIRVAIQEGYSLNLNTNQLAAYIRKKVGVINRNRATLIARTEATTASNLGKEQGAKDWFKSQGENGYKMWVGREDGRERPTHTALNDKAIPISEDFKVGGELAQRPGDIRLSGDERCNCRCTTQYISERLYNRLYKK